MIIDWLMPTVDGLELCRRIRASEHSSGTYIIIATGRGTMADVTSAINAGADDFIAKPLTAKHLRAQVTIAERRIDERAARWRAEGELSRAQWLAGIGHTTRAMQHEINNPLTALLMETEMLASDPDLPARCRASVDVIAQQGARIRHVIKVLSALKDPKTIEPLHGVHMLDLSDSAK